MVGLTALSLGLVAVGSGNPEIATQLLTQLMERNSELEMRDTYSKFLALGLALVYLGKALFSRLNSPLTEYCNVQ